MSLAEGLFEAEAELRDAAVAYREATYSAALQPKKINAARKALRAAALAYAKHANYIDDVAGDLAERMEAQQ